MRFTFLSLTLVLIPFPATAGAADQAFPLFAYLTGTPIPTMITYTPADLDPRVEANNRRLLTRSIRADLEALRPAFDGLILYGYHEACTPRILALAKELKFRAVIFGIWDPKSVAEVDGIAELVRQFEKDFAMGVLVGNEGLLFKRYEIDDVKFAAARLRAKLPATIPLATSEPLVGYKDEFVRTFGDFLAPNIHPVFDRKDLPPAEAAAWAREQALALAQQTKKPTLLKETGFPHAGREPYTPESQKAYWEAYTRPGLLTRIEGGAWAFHGVAFEAFDLPWKADESRLAIEKSWGLLSNKRAAYPAFDHWKTLRQDADKAGK